MIFTKIATAKVMKLEGWLHEESGTVKDLPTSKDDVGYCSCDSMCEYKELATVFPSDTDNTFKNDYRAVLVTLLDSGSTYTFEVIDSSGTATTLVNGTHGQLFNLGFNSDQPLKVGFRIDWYKIYNVLGVGDYTIKVTQTDFGVTTENTSEPTVTSTVKPTRSFPILSTA